MSVRFLPDAGFQKSGGFVEDFGDEAGREIVYERYQYLSVNIRCRDLRLWHDFYGPLRDRGFAQRRICGVGDLQPANWGSWSLSLLGSKAIHRTVSVNLVENTEEAPEFYVAGSPACDDGLDVLSDEGFFVEVALPPDHFKRVLDEITNYRCDLELRVVFDRFRGFLAEWSPSISEGRTIKFLNSDRDVENAEDIPAVFWEGEAKNRPVSSSYTAPVGITLTRQLETSTPPPSDVGGDKQEEGIRPHRKQASTMKLTRWERGALRLWIVVASAWTAFIALLEFDAVISVGVMPAIALLVFGAGVMWAIRGFRGGD